MRARGLALSLAVAAALAPAARAEPDPRIPPLLRRQANRDASPFFERDPNKPNHLHPSKRAIENGIDRDTIEALVRPPIDPAVLDEIEAIKGKRSVRIDPPQGVPSPFLATRSGEVIVIQGNNLTVNTNAGLSFDHNGGFFDVANVVLSQYGDVFDFISVWTTFPDNGVAAYYFPVKQDTENLGDCNPNAGDTFGCVFDQTQGRLERLQGLVFMNSISMWQEWDRGFDGVVHPLDSFDSACYSTLGQEIAHRWGSALRYRDRSTGNISRKLLGRDNSHWAAWLDTDASVMDGWDWEEGDGRFELINDMDRYSQLDLYTIGALAPGQVRDFFWIDDARFDEDDGLGIDGRSIPADAVLAYGLPSVQQLEQYDVDLGATGTRVDVRMQDVLDAEGMRCPDPDHAPRAFRQAFVLITAPGETEAQALDEAAELEVVEATWEAWWHDRTDRAVTLCSSLDGDCAQATAELLIEDDIEVDLGTSGKTTVTVKATGATVKGAVLALSLSGQNADSAKLKETTLDLGDIPAGQERKVDIEFDVDEDATCGLSFVIDTELVSDNARTERQSVRVLPGYRLITTYGFSDGEAFAVNDDGKDSADAASGALAWRQVETSCEMSARSPERDNSADNRGAFVTQTRLDGGTSLWSPEFNLTDTADPEVRFAYWLDGEGGALKVQVSRDGGDSFRDADTFDEPGHSWAQGTVQLRDVFSDELPEDVVVRFIFSGAGDVEGGIDDVRLVDIDGVCLARSAYACGCDSTGAATPQAAVGFLAALLGVRALRRRRVRAAT